MGEDNRRRDFANCGCEFSQGAEVVNDLEIVAQAGVVRRIKHDSGTARFAFAIFAEFGQRSL
jgi:hypothetical protein